MIDRDYGGNLLGSFAQYDRARCAWKTCQACLFAEWDEYAATWPASGTILSGTAYQRPRSARTTSGIGCGSSAHAATYPTPTAAEYGSGGNGSGNSTTSRGRPSLQTMARRDQWPTPTARDRHTVAKGTRGATAGRGGRPLVLAIQGKDSHGRDRAAGLFERDQWPTPTAGDAKGAGNRNLTGSKANPGESLTDAVNGGQGSRRGQLNPAWVEWLMGFPIGWTAFED